MLKIEYDENIISLEKLLEHFLRFVDPYSVDKQAEDVGHQYRSGVYGDKADIIKAKAYFDKVLKDNYKIELLELVNYYKAEEYHQDYLTKNPKGYCHANLGLIKDEEKETIN